MTPCGVVFHLDAGLQNDLHALSSSSYVAHLNVFTFFLKGCGKIHWMDRTQFLFALQVGLVKARTVAAQRAMELQLVGRSTAVFFLLSLLLLLFPAFTAFLALLAFPELHAFPTFRAFLASPDSLLLRLSVLRCSGFSFSFTVFSCFLNCSCFPLIPYLPYFPCSLSVFPRFLSNCSCFSVSLYSFLARSPEARYF